MNDKMMDLDTAQTELEVQGAQAVDMSALHYVLRKPCSRRKALPRIWNF
mgnify:CR=1 FL=1